MRNKAHCQAERKDSVLFCIGCTPDCQVSRIKNKFGSGGGEVWMTEHNSEYLKILKSIPAGAGVTGIACTLNLLEGGFALLQKHIPAQCVYLNYSGCSKHWGDSSSVTSIFEEQISRQQKISQAGKRVEIRFPQQIQAASFSLGVVAGGKNEFQF
jgi:hypothetical protein